MISVLEPAVIIKLLKTYVLMAEEPAQPPAPFVVSWRDNPEWEGAVICATDEKGIVQDIIVWAESKSYTGVGTGFLPGSRWARDALNEFFNELYCKDIAAKHVERSLQRADEIKKQAAIQHYSAILAKRKRR